MNFEWCNMVRNKFPVVEKDLRRIQWVSKKSRLGTHKTSNKDADWEEFDGSMGGRYSSPNIDRILSNSPNYFTENMNFQIVLI